MKKLIAVLIALAMVLSMSVMSFASWTTADGETISSPSEIATKEMWERAANPTGSDLFDPNLPGIQINIRQQKIYTKEDNVSIMTWDEAWVAYYNLVLSGVSSNPTGAVGEIVNSVKDGHVAAGDAIKMVGDAVMGGVGGDGGAGDLSGVIDQIIGSIGGGKEPEVTTEAYVEELKALINSGADFDAISTKISDDLTSGKIVVSQLPDIAKALTELIDAGEIENNETVQKILEFIDSLGGEGGIEFPSFGDITLPWDQGNSESGSFLDTILGIIGSIGDIFNPGAGDDPSADDPSDPGTDEPTEIPDTGDVSFVAVAAVAAVAGVALVLTRKKNDAE